MPFDKDQIDQKLAYEYARVKPEEIYRVVTHDYQDLIEFAKQIMSYVKESTH